MFQLSIWKKKKGQISIDLYNYTILTSLQEEKYSLMKCLEQLKGRC